MLGVTTMARQTRDRNEQAHRFPTGSKARSKKGATQTQKNKWSSTCL
jgi:hypothetical protein